MNATSKNQTSADINRPNFAANTLDSEGNGGNPAQTLDASIVNTVTAAQSTLAGQCIDANGNLILPPDMYKLTSALRSLPNICDLRTLALYRAAPLVREAKLFPGIAVDLHDLLKKWVSGTLGGVSTSMSPTTGRNGASGIELLDALWLHFMAQTGHQGKFTTLGSVYFHAKQAGWVYQYPDFADIGY